ncbi:MAG TPA: hypothetical protein IAB62_03230 [Candidatus Coprocola pullicola]|nr:hypothetical protein [Candidatus Coprocola pullicola]
MIEIKMECEKCDIQTEGNFLSVQTEFTTEISKVMEELLTQCHVIKGR